MTVQDKDWVTITPTQNEDRSITININLAKPDAENGEYDSITIDEFTTEILKAYQETILFTKIILK